MADNLKLQVILSALDKASGPLKRIQDSGSGASKALKATRDKVRQLNDMQNNVASFKNYRDQLQATSQELQTARDKHAAVTRALDSHRSTQQALAAETKIHRAEVSNLQKQILKSKEPNAELNRQYLMARDNLAQLEKRYGGSQSQMRRYKEELKNTAQNIQLLNGKHGTQTQRLTELTTKLRDAGIGVDRLGDHEKELAGGIERANKLLEAQKDKLKALQNLRSKGAGLRDAGGQVLDRGKSLLAQGAVAGAAGGYLFKTQFLDRAAEFETYQTILKTVTGSEKEAQKAMAWVSDFAARTPYEMGEVLESFTRLKAYGIDPMADGLLRTLGDTASAMGKPVMQAVEAIADAVTGENERLKEFGIRGSKSKGMITYEYTNAAGETMQKTVDAGNRKLIASTLQAIWNDKYAGAMEDQSKTWAGMVSNLSDQWARFTNMVMSAGLFDLMKDRLSGLLDTVDRMAANGELAAWASKVGKGMLRFAEGAWQVGTALMNISTALSNAVGGWQNLVYIMAALKLAPLTFAVGKLAFAFGSTGLALGKFLGVGAMAVKFGAAVSTAVRVVSIALWGLALNPVFLVIGAAVALVAGAAYLIYKNWEPIKAFFLNLWAEIKERFSGGLDSIAALILSFSPLGLFHNAFAAVMGYFGIELPGKFTEFGAMLMQGLVNGITNGLAAAKEAITGAGGAVIGWFKEKLGIRSPSRVFAQLGGFTMAGLAQGLMGGEGDVLKQIGATAQRVVGAGADMLGGVSIDRRAPLAARGAAATSSGGNTYNFVINATPGMDPAAIGREVQRQLAAVERQQQARGRARLGDQD